MNGSRRDFIKAAAALAASRALPVQAPLDIDALPKMPPIPAPPLETSFELTWSDDQLAQVTRVWENGKLLWSADPEKMRFGDNKRALTDLSFSSAAATPPPPLSETPDSQKR